MKIVAVLFAGVLFSSTIFAGQGDPGAEARFRAKFGRSTPAEESRKAVSAVKADRQMDCATCECCHRKHA